MNTKTLKLRIKDKHSAVLRAWSSEVNMVFNYCNEVSAKASTSYTNKPKWLSGYDLQALTSGLSKCEGINISSTTIQQTCEEFATRRKQFKKLKLRWRVSNRKSPKHSLGWIPFKTGSLKYKQGQVKFNGVLFSLWDSYGLSSYELRDGSFSEDNKGHWYLNATIKVATEKSKGDKVLGIDLGLKEAVTTSEGETLLGRWYRAEEKKIKLFQSRGQKKRAKALHTKVKNRRKDALHKLSTKFVKENKAIFVGNVSTKKLVKTKMAKSTLDASWYMFKTMLEYKSNYANVVFKEVNESYSTQTCSACGVIPTSSPKGLAGLNKRNWTCSSCGSEHLRDVNAAKNIRAYGLVRLVEGISSL